MEKNNVRSGWIIVTGWQRALSNATSKLTSLSSARTSVKFMVVLVAVLLSSTVLFYENQPQSRL
jgi:hypothetical protein